MDGRCRCRPSSPRGSSRIVTMSRSYAVLAKGGGPAGPASFAFETRLGLSLWQGDDRLLPAKGQAVVVGVSAVDRLPVVGPGRDGHPLGRRTQGHPEVTVDGRARAGGRRPEGEVHCPGRVVAAGDGERVADLSGWRCCATRAGLADDDRLVGAAANRAEPVVVGVARVVDPPVVGPDGRRGPAGGVGRDAAADRTRAAERGARQRRARAVAVEGERDVAGRVVAAGERRGVTGRDRDADRPGRRAGLGAKSNQSIAHFK